jgi:carboxypeptidase C (cathepsin A)
MANRLSRHLQYAAIAIALLAPPGQVAEAQQGGRQRPAGTEAGGQPGGQTGSPAREDAARSPQPGLPPDKTTQHKLTVAGREIAFAATAGTIPLFDERSGTVSASLAYIAFARTDTGGSRERPVTFVWNGGPGYASAWLNLGAMGPWRLDMAGDATRPSASPVLHSNAETWLDFTDLVFLDPAGTGFGRIQGNDDVRKHLWSVEGDIASLATAIRRWLTNNDRIASPKFLAGESYGGFRVPKVARRLQTDEGIGIKGLVLISPVLDFARFRSGGVLSHVARLPAYAATAREKAGPVTREQLSAVESYAQGEFLADLMKGLSDKQALARLSDKVATLTGLDRRLVAQLGGRVPLQVFIREIHRGERRVASIYDGNETSIDPDPYSASSEAEDQMLKGLHAPIVTAMLETYRRRLEWLPENGRYMFSNRAANRQWDWGSRQNEATSDLAAVTALDSKLRVLVVHGLTDLITPYFETKMVLDQMAPVAGEKRLQLKVYPGGHMFYSRETSRQAFRDDGRALVQGIAGTR